MTFILLVLIFALCWGITHRLIPLFFVRIGRLLGFRMKMTPLTEKRVKKFKSIKRGYYCFVIISTLLVMSLGLELFVNNKPLYIRHQNTVQYPALANWFNFYWPGEPMKDQAQKKYFGLEGVSMSELTNYALMVL